MEAGLARVDVLRFPRDPVWRRDLESIHSYLRTSSNVRAGKRVPQVSALSHAEHVCVISTQKPHSAPCQALLSSSYHYILNYNFLVSP